ncbi:MAG: hypothetical protein K2Y37_03575 [Pirellulales bacterium]|nr:hypothetical protein [Pirellulales bacterium]
MKKTWLSALALACLLALPLVGRAQEAEEPASEMKPLIVASLRSFDELIDDLDFIGKVSDNPDLGQGIEGLLELATQGQGLDMLDKTKPWGFAVSSDGLELQVLGFLPINDLEKFATTLGGLAGDPQKSEDGVWKFEILNFSLFMKQSGDWTFVSISGDFLQNLPADPTKYLGGLNKDYDGAVRVHMQNIPDVFRQLIIDQLKMGAEQVLAGEELQLPIPGLENLPGGGLPGADALPKLTEEQRKLVEALAKGQIQTMTEALNETDTITFGFNVDRDAAKLLADAIVTAVPGSKTAEGFAKMTEGKTKFAGFKLPDAAVYAVINEVLSADQISQAKEAVATIKEEINTRVAGLGFGDDHLKELLKGFVAELLGIGEKTVESGKIDFGVAMLGKGPYTLLGGGYISDNDAATKLLDKLIETVETEVGFYGFQKNVAEHKGVKFSSVLLPIPPGEEGDLISKIIGSEVELVIGIGDKSAYIAIGANGLDELKKAIDKSEEEAGKSVPAIEFSASLVPLVKLAAGQPDADPNLATLATALEGTADRVVVTVKPIENGVHMHLDGQDGILKALGTMITTMGPGLPQF